MIRLTTRYTAQGDPPPLPYAGDPEDLPFRQAGHAALRGPWPSEETASVRAMWDTLASGWKEIARGPHQATPLVDAVERIEHMPDHVLEVGTGTGLGTRALMSLLPKATLVAADLSPAMLREARAEGTRTPLVATDSAALAFKSEAFDLVVLLNTYLFPTEVLRVLVHGGSVIGAWSLGAKTPIYISPEQAEDALGAEAVTAEAAWGDWWRVRPLGA